MNAADLLIWPHVTPQIARQAIDEYQAEFGRHDKELLESPGWWLWTRTRELAQDQPMSYAQQIDDVIRSAILAAGGLGRDMPVLDSPSLLRKLMELDPSLTEEGAKGLLTQYRDLAATTRQMVEMEDLVEKQ